MKKYLYTVRADLIFSEPVTDHTFLLRATPISDSTQEPMRSSISCKPVARLTESRDSQGNIVSLGYISEKHTSFSFCSTGEVLIDSSKRNRDGVAAYYRFATPLTHLSGSLEEYYLASRIDGNVEARVDHWIGRLQVDFRYEKGVTKTSTTAAQAWELGSGVCQDYTHLLLSFLRADGIICRYVAGLMVGEGVSHAWVEYFNGDVWVGVDPTHARVCNDDYMKISCGTDFSSCALERGIFMGNGEQTMFSKCSLTEI